MPLMRRSLNVVCFLCVFARRRALLNRIQGVPSLSPNEGYTNHLVCELYSLAWVICHLLAHDGLQVNFRGFSLSEARHIVQTELLSLRSLIEDVMHRPLPIVQIRTDGFSWYQPSTDFHNSIVTNANVTRRNENHHMGDFNILSIPNMLNEHPTLLQLFPEQPLSCSIPTSGTGLGDTNNILSIPTMTDEHPTLLPLFPEQPLPRSIPTSGTEHVDTYNILSIPNVPNEHRTLLPLFPEQPLSRSIPTSGAGLGNTNNILSIPFMPNEHPKLLPLFPEQPLSRSIPTSGTELYDTNGFQMQGSIESTPVNTNEDVLDLELSLG